MKIEKEQLKQQIVFENQVLIKTRKINRNILFFFGLFIMMSIFGFRNRLGYFNSLKWVFYIGTIFLLIGLILSMISYFNGKRKVMYLIEQYNKMK